MLNFKNAQILNETSYWSPRVYKNIWAFNKNALLFIWSKTKQRKIENRKQKQRKRKIKPSPLTWALGPTNWSGPAHLALPCLLPPGDRAGSSPPWRACPRPPSHLGLHWTLLGATEHAATPSSFPSLPGP